jgi:hypothetical protein
MSVTRLASRAAERVVTDFLEVGAHHPERDQQGSHHRGPTDRPWAPTSSVVSPAGLDEGGATKWSMPPSLAALPARCRRVTGVEGRPGHVPRCRILTAALLQVSPGLVVRDRAGHAAMTELSGQVRNTGALRAKIIWRRAVIPAVSRPVSAENAN